jgi:ComF family protein
MPHAGADGGGADLGLCGPCLEEAPFRSGGFCPGCGCLTEPAGEPPRLCGPCRAEPKPWSRLAFYGRYDGVLKDLVLDYKFGGRLDRAHVLQGLVLHAYRERLADGPPDLIVPVPLHPRRLQRRGFNQSLELSRRLSKATGRPVVPEALVRVRETTPQSSLGGRAERVANIRGAFRAEPDLASGRSALLVDDILTTGATLEECARALQAAGASEVAILVLLKA